MSFTIYLFNIIIWGGGGAGGGGGGIPIAPAAPAKVPFCLSLFVDAVS